MNTSAADRIAKAVLYEGYMLYPYRPSSVKNQQRFNFGVVYPEVFSVVQKGTEPCTMQTECLVQGDGLAKLEVRVRFLQLVDRSVEAIAERQPAAASEFHPVKALTVNGQTFYSWQEAVERELTMQTTALTALGLNHWRHSFHLSESASEDPVRNAQEMLHGRIVRTQHAIDGELEVQAQPVADQTFKITVRVRNTTNIEDAAHISRDHVMSRSLVSVHIVLGIEGGEFVSLLDPPEELQAATAGCHNQGAFPVLIGDDGQKDTVIASPIILYDYPQIAPESPGDLFDGTEIDEILSLRIMTMTDEEKREMRESDERARQMLERTETMPAEQFMKLHGAMRGLRPLKEDSP